MFRWKSLCVAAMILAGLPFSALAAGPGPTDLLFKLRQLDLVDKGREMTYEFERKVSDAKLVGNPFSDSIRIGVTKVGAKGERHVTMKIFSGERAHDLQNYPDLTTNPIFLWYLDRTVSQFSLLTGAQPPYLKGRFRSSFDEKGKVEAVKADYNGKSVDAYRITVLPYEGDPSASKMRGYDRSSFSFIVSDAVPGYFVSMMASYQSSGKGTPRVEEQLKLVRMGEIQ